MVDIFERSFSHRLPGCKNLLRIGIWNFRAQPFKSNNLRSSTRRRTSGDVLRESDCGTQVKRTGLGPVGHRGGGTT